MSLGVRLLTISEDRTAFMIRLLNCSRTACLRTYRKYDPPKRRALHAERHGVASQNSSKSRTSEGQKLDKDELCL